MTFPITSWANRIKLSADTQRSSNHGPYHIYPHFAILFFFKAKTKQMPFLVYNLLRLQSQVVRSLPKSWSFQICSSPLYAIYVKDCWSSGAVLYHPELTKVPFVGLTQSLSSALMGHLSLSIQLSVSQLILSGTYPIYCHFSSLTSEILSAPSYYQIKTFNPPYYQIKTNQLHALIFCLLRVCLYLCVYAWASV